MNTAHQNWFAGLKSLSQSDFPKKCACCGRVYQSEEDYFQETKAIRNAHTGLKVAQDDDDGLLVELFRNCVCGSTLLAFFSDRRDQSDAGNIRRKLFDEVLDYIVQTGVAPITARTELLRVIHGEQSDMLELWHAKILAAEKNGGLMTLIKSQQ
ncbi:oxidoreductase [Solimicrobium silvestre]|uniref:Uncharacterized protein n=1 Tax=Solimicrobium silvestre TaxID=2099400 RepID=A0A2S9H2P3_9BURK|nr:oxidoreductase [Solimicrobium silvestre]PRC94249.1 hypothetical protein S2091_0870 [Solimicrobium silvestre]